MHTIIRKQIHSCFAGMSSTDAYVQLETGLTFVPHVGMYLRVDGEEEQVVEVHYIVSGPNAGRLVVYVHPDEELYEAGRESLEQGGPMCGSPERLRQIVAEYVERGWTEDRGK